MTPEPSTLSRPASHAAACFGCGDAAVGAGLRMRFTDDGRVTRATLTLDPAWARRAGSDEALDAAVFAALQEAVHHAAWARLHADEAESDGQSTFYAQGVRVGAPLVVEAWPGRRSGSGFFFYARALQDGEERAHLETWLRGH